MSKSIPNTLVYLVLYAAIFFISCWILIFHPDSPTNWALYVLLAVATLAGVVKFYLHRKGASRNK